MEGNNKDRVKIKKIENKNERCQVWFSEEILKMDKTVAGFAMKQNRRQIDDMERKKRHN